MSKMRATDVEYIFKKFAQSNPHPEGELTHQSVFELLVAVILSAQATDISVNKATCKLYQHANTPESILALGEKGLKPFIKTIGLYNAKAKNIIKMCAMLLDEFDGTVPNNLHDLMRLPGVGRKTANVVLQMAFGQATIAVDTHVFRVSRRLGLATGKTPDKVEQDLLNIIPPNYHQYAHHWLILHGRYVCKARKPLCQDCFLRSVCVFYNKSDLCERS